MTNLIRKLHLKIDEDAAERALILSSAILVALPVVVAALLH
jgi:hypothetical protein